MASPAISDEQVVRSLGPYAGMVGHVLADPEHWLAVDDEPSAHLPGRAVEAVGRRLLGDTGPGSTEWPGLPVDQRVGWWVARIGAVGGLAAAAPRFAGLLADRVPLQATLGAAASGLAVCATAREHGVTTPSDWVPLLGRVLFDRELPHGLAVVPDDEASQQALTEPAGDGDPDEERQDRGGSRVGRSARTFWRLARTLHGVDELLDHRPRGGLLARTLAKAPVIGVAGGWLDERAAIRHAADETAGLVSAR